MEHLIDHYFIREEANIKGFVFGFVHVGITILGYYTGLSINRLLKFMTNGYIAGIFGAALSHIIADIIASFIDPHIRSMLLGIVVGGVIPLLLIPVLEKYFNKSKNHIMIGDHNDIKKDLKSH